jgi:hypothetical protein
MGDVSKGWPAHSIAGLKNIQTNLHYFSAVLWILIGFNADSDPDLALNLNADPDPGSQANADYADSDPNPGHTKGHKKLNFYIKYIY